jgi:hypothetical protein
VNEIASVSQHLTPAWAVAPFVGYLLLIAILPLFAPRLWEHNRNKLILAVVAGVPAIVYLAGLRGAGVDQLLRTGCDYVSFMVLLGALFAISGGICLRGALIGTPIVNTLFLGRGRRPGQRRRDDGSVGAADPTVAARKRAPRPHDPHRRVLHLHRRQRGRPVDAARRSTVVPRLPPRRAVHVDAAPRARLGAGQRRAARAVRGLRSGGRSSAIAASRARPARRIPLSRSAPSVSKA